MTIDLRHKCNTTLRSFTIMLILSTAGATKTTWSDSDPYTELEFTSRWYLGGGIGASQLQPNPREPEKLTVSDESDTGFHLNLGYDVNRWLSAELYFSSLGEAVLDRIDAGNEQAALDSIDYQLLDLSAVGYLYNTKSGFAWSDNPGGLNCREALSIYGRVSLGVMSNGNSENQISHGRNFNQHIGFGAGLEYGFRNGFGIRAEWISFDKDAEYTNLALIKRIGDSPCQQTPPPVKVEPKTIDKKNSAKAFPVQAYQPEPEVILPPVSYFGFDRHALDTDSANELELFAAQVLDKPGKIELSGHTDSQGSDAYNLYLSEQRVLAVRRILIANKVAPSRISIESFGETRPASTNDTSAGRALNRRVNRVFVPE